MVVYMMTVHGYEKMDKVRAFFLTKEQQFQKESDAGMLLALLYAKHKIMVGCMWLLFMHWYTKEKEQVIYM